MVRSYVIAAALLLSSAPLAPGASSRYATARIPAVQGTALDGHNVSLPQDLSPASILIIGFTQKAAGPTAEWSRNIRLGLATPQSISFYELPMLAEVPGFARPLVLRSIRKQVPDIAKPTVVPITRDEATWKSLTGYSASAPDSAYVLLVDRSGAVRWKGHDAFSQDTFALLASEARRLAAGTP